MKKYICMLLLSCISLALVFILGSCDHDIESVPTNEPTEQATPESTYGADEEPGSGSGDELAAAGVITGDVLYKDIAISRLFVEPFVDVLGSPLSEREAFYSYDDGLIIIGDRGDLIGSFNMAIQLTASESNLNLFEINGVTLDKTWAELIATLGNPVEYYENTNLAYHTSDNSLISYRVLSPKIDYILALRFDNPDDKTAISSISIFREGRGDW